MGFHCIGSRGYFELQCGLCNNISAFDTYILHMVDPAPRTICIFWVCYSSLCYTWSLQSPAQIAFVVSAPMYNLVTYHTSLHAIHTPITISIFCTYLRVCLLTCVQRQLCRTVRITPWNPCCMQTKGPFACVFFCGRKRKGQHGLGLLSTTYVSSCALWRHAWEPISSPCPIPVVIAV